MTRSKFIVVEHDAKKARLHWDLRFQMPKSSKWASFAIRKGIPTTPGKKVLAIKTHDHSRAEALFIGTIKDGYGAGKLKKWDDGSCIIHKYSPSHIAIEFKGRKVKGIYHLISTGVVDRNYKRQTYFLFKGKIVTEWMGMISRIPGLWGDEVESSPSYQEGPKLPWSKRRTIVKNGKQLDEWYGMISRIPPDPTEEVEQSPDWQYGPKLFWSKIRTIVKNDKQMRESFGVLASGQVGRAPPSDTQEVESDHESEDRKLSRSLPWSLNKKIQMIRSKEDEYDHDD